MALKRRTQQQRREETIGKLIQATIDSLLEVGFRATTVKEICRRSGVSHGGLFRHFPSVLDIVLAAAEEVARQQVTNFETRFTSMPESERSLAGALKLVRDACRSPANTVFYELLVAARTNEELRTALEPQVRRYYDAILASAKRVPGIPEVPPDLLEALVFGVVHMFDGESLVRAVRPSPEHEAMRLALLGELLGLIGNADKSPPDR